MGRHNPDRLIPPWEYYSNQGEKKKTMIKNREWIVTVIISMLAGAGYFYSFYNIVSIKLSLMFSFAMSGLTGAFLILLLREVNNLE